MNKKAAALVLCLSSLLWFARPAAAEAFKMYRYTDAAGKRYYVQHWGDVPLEYRASASAVMVAKEPPPEEAPPAEQAAETAGDTVKVLSFVFSPTEEKMAAFKGEVENQSKSTVTGVKLHLDVKTAAEMKTVEVTVGPNGSLKPDEKVKVETALDLPAASVGGYAFSLSWEGMTQPVQKAPQAPAEKTAEPAQGEKQLPETITRRRRGTRNYPPPKGYYLDTKPKSEEPQQ